MLLDFYNYITSTDGKDIIVNGWKASGIYDANRLGLDKLPSSDPFHDIDPLIEHDATPSALNLDAVCKVDEEELNAYRQVTDEEKEEDVWESEGDSRNAFDMFGGFDDEPDL